VSIKTPYAAGRYEVSRDQFAAFVEDAKYQSSSGCVVGGRQSLGANWQQPGFEQAGNHPVVCVAWRDAKAYVAWLSTKTNKKYRLLSESEWEYMARAKARTPFANGAALGSGNANFNRGRDGTIPIGYTTSNDFGFFDVHGNVWELVDDCWYPDLGFNSNDGRATLLRGDCSERVIKGGGWDSTALQSRLAARGRVAVGSAANTVGFRVARAMD
jgi:formylglycine-generating enzyme required for sulfatase activity